MSSSSSPRFGAVCEDDKQKLLDSAIPQSTKTATKYWLSVFADYWQENGKVCDFDAISETDLAELLENFYCCARKKDKTEYKRASLIAARGAIQRHVNSKNRGICLQSSAFSRANKLLDAILKDKKRTGREEAVSHKESISDEDWALLKGYFSDVLTTLNARKLTQFVWFHTTLHFCLRGNEAQAQLKVSDLVFTTIGGEEAIVLNAEYMSALIADCCICCSWTSSK